VLPDVIRSEILVAICILPLIIAHLDLPVDPKAQAIDSSHAGGAVVEKPVDPWEMIDEMQIAERRGLRTQIAQAKAEALTEALTASVDRSLPWFLQTGEIAEAEADEAFDAEAVPGGSTGVGPRPRRGVLEINSDEGRLSSALRRYGWRASEVGSSHRRELDDSVFDEERAQIEAGAYSLVVLWVPHETWSGGYHRPLRTAEHPGGVPALSGHRRWKVDSANDDLRRALSLIELGKSAGAGVAVIRGVGSTARWMPEMEAVRRQEGTESRTFDACAYGCVRRRRHQVFGYLSALPLPHLQCKHSGHSCRDIKMVGDQGIPFLAEDWARQLDDWWNKKADLIERERLAGAEQVPGIPARFVRGSWSCVWRHKWRRLQHINVLEGLSLVRAAERVTQVAGRCGKQHLILTDSLVCLGLCQKGRSSRPMLNRVTRRLAALALGYRQHFLFRWVSTKLNPADGPSRSFA